MPIELPPKAGLLLPPKPAIIRAWKREDLRHKRASLFPLIVPRAGAVAFPTVVTTNSGNETAFDTTYPSPLPGSLVSGNLLLMILGAWSSVGAIQYNTPAGWTSLFQSSGTGQLRSLAAFYKVSNGSEGASVAMTLTGAGGYKASVAYQINGQNGNPEAGTTATGTSSAPNPPSLSPSWGSTSVLWLAVMASLDASVVAQTAPTNYTNILQNATGANDQPRTAAARRELIASSEDPGAFGSSTGTWAANTIAIRG